MSTVTVIAAAADAIPDREHPTPSVVPASSLISIVEVAVPAAPSGYVLIRGDRMPMFIAPYPGSWYPGGTSSGLIAVDVSTWIAPASLTVTPHVILGMPYGPSVAVSECLPAYAGALTPGGVITGGLTPTSSPAPPAQVGVSAPTLTLVISTPGVDPSPVMAWYPGGMVGGGHSAVSYNDTTNTSDFQHLPTQRGEPWDSAPSRRTAAKHLLGPDRGNDSTSGHIFVDSERTGRHAENLRQNSVARGEVCPSWPRILPLSSWPHPQRQHQCRHLSRHPRP